jgi:hypothetical protein
MCCARVKPDSLILTTSSEHYIFRFCYATLGNPFGPLIPRTNMMYPRVGYPCLQNQLLRDLGMFPQKSVLRTEIWNESGTAKCMCLISSSGPQARICCGNGPGPRKSGLAPGTPDSLIKSHISCRSVLQTGFQAEHQDIQMLCATIRSETGVLHTPLFAHSESEFTVARHTAC